MPDIYAFSENLEFILQEDFGDKTLDTANSIDESNLINQALSELSKIYAVDQSVLKSFTEEDLLNQTNNFFKIFSYKKAKNSSSVLSRSENLSIFINIINLNGSRLYSLSAKESFNTTFYDEVIWTIRIAHH